MRYLQAEQQMVGMMAEVLDQPLVNCPSYVWQGEKKLHLYLSVALPFLHYPLLMKLDSI
jgi:hypothetical protein